MTRPIVSRLAVLAAVLLTLSACGDSPTQAGQPRTPGLSTPVQDVQTPVGCVIEGFCVLPPLIVDGGCDPWESLDWCDGGDCMTTVPWSPVHQGTMGCPGGGGAPGAGGGTIPPPTDPGSICPTAATGDCPEAPEGPECEDCNPPEEESTICPQPFVGNVLPALINVAGRNHEFQFTGTPTRPLRRLTGGASPATYQIGLPESSKNAWWIAESGTIRVMCRGAWVRRRLWVGQLYMVDSDLHMVMGPGHPDF